jgi:ribonuclease HI
MHLILHTDGGSRGNPGPAGMGMVLLREDGTVHRRAKGYLGVRTNNEAEYAALIAGLRMAKESGATHVTVRMDSELIVRQMLGVYKVKTPHIKELFEKARAEMRGFESVRYEHVFREKNKEADKMVNKAIDDALAKSRS